MPDVLLRNVDAGVLDRLKTAAKAHGRSLQAELQEILEQASTRSLAETRRISAKWLRRLRHSSHSDSTELIRGDRER